MRQTKIMRQYQSLDIGERRKLRLKIVLANHGDAERRSMVTGCRLRHMPPVPLGRIV
jgi:hypothetical protein